MILLFIQPSLKPLSCCHLYMSVPPQQPVLKGWVPDGYQHYHHQVCNKLGHDRKSRDTSSTISCPAIGLGKIIAVSFHLTTKHHLLILYTSEQLQRAFQCPPLIAFRCLKNLRDLLVWATLTSMSHQPPSNYPCRVSKCKTCPIVMAMDEFSGHTTGQSYKVNVSASCKSSNVIYLITCKRHGLQYVGHASCM